MTSHITREKLIDLFDDRIDTARKEIAKLAAKLADETQDPLSAMAWSDAAFRAAATFSVLSRYRPYVADAQPELTLAQCAEAILRDARDAVLRGARSPSMSTSVPSNLAATYELAAHADVADTAGFASLGRTLARIAAQGEPSEGEQA